MTNKTIIRQGVARCRVDQLEIGQRVDLQNDIFADTEAYEAFLFGAEGKASQHPEFEFEFETVAEVERETTDCICVTFESGFSCGFPPSHEVDIDAEQDPATFGGE